MRICYYADGRYVHAERWMRFFAGRGHEMHLISFETVPEDRVAQLRQLGIKYHGHTGNFHLKRFWNTIRDIRFIRGVLRAENIDILHSHFLGPNTWFATLSGFHPHIITVMGGDVIGPDWAPSSGLRDQTLTPYALRKADRLTAWSHMLARRISPYVASGKEIEIVHGGVDLGKFAPGTVASSLRESLNIPASGKIVFSPRLIRPLYNIDVIALAAGIVCDQIQDVYFVTVLPEHILDQSYADKVKEIFERGSAKEQVRFIPAIKHDQIAYYFRMADITLSIPQTDGTPMAVLESMACGTPTVIGDLPDYDPEYFEHEKTTLMVDVKDPNSVALAILRLFQDDELRNRITDEARARVEKTGGYEYQMTKMEGIYTSLLGKKQSP